MSGIYNGAMMTVYAIRYKENMQQHELEIPIVFMQMDDFKGKSCYADVPNIVPFCALASYTKIKGKYTRWQLPIAVAHASTVHRYQGQTAKHALVLYIPKQVTNTMRGLVYVMMSRPTRIEDVHLMNHHLKKEHFNSPALQIAMIRAEYKRLHDKFL